MNSPSQSEHFCYFYTLEVVNPHESTRPSGNFVFCIVVIASFVMLFGACGGESKDNFQQIPIPQVTQPPGPRPLRCESVLVSDSESDNKVYRNFFIEVLEDGTESIVNQVEGDAPCP